MELKRSFLHPWFAASNSAISRFKPFVTGPLSPSFCDITIKQNLNCSVWRLVCVQTHNEGNITPKSWFKQTRLFAAFSVFEIKHYDKSNRLQSLEHYLCVMCVTVESTSLHLHVSTIDENRQSKQWAQRELFIFIVVMFISTLQCE